MPAGFKLGCQKKCLKSHINKFLYSSCFMGLFPRQRDTEERDWLRKKEDTSKCQHSS